MEDKNTIFKEFDRHLMEDKEPSHYFNEILGKGEFPNIYPFTLLEELTDVPQSPKHHPEGSVWKHTMLVVDNAAEKKEVSEEPHAFMWAALLHDLGKKPTTKLRKGRITSYDHDRHGERIAREFLEELTNDEEFIDKVSALVRWHMQALFVVKDLPFADIEKMLSQISVDEVALLTLCDRLGRGEMTEERHAEEEENIKTFVHKSKNYRKH
ncbi:HDIG domain-containing metalloprotein [Clostridium ganghwense]|uniref:HDIG domain-containing protein n=1 Tax=Clostridium ganghwense TaxID=312089 RepID=A0ABT4CSJ3_9CLOT|nr:HDIG domain-containing metalloprotein [Clostridium ganghwense]MCY6372045.1 HDIG domain-containing protein [Clostridium ganghwense]